MPEDAEGSQTSQTALSPGGVWPELRILRSFAVLRDSAFGYVASAALDDNRY